MNVISRVVLSTALALSFAPGSAPAQKPTKPAYAHDEKPAAELLAKLAKADPKDDELRKLTKELCRESAEVVKQSRGRLGRIAAESYIVQLADLLSAQRTMIEAGLMICEKPEERRLLLNELVAQVKMYEEGILEGVHLKAIPAYLGSQFASIRIAAQIQLMRFELPTEPIAAANTSRTMDKEVRTLQSDRYECLLEVLRQQHARLGQIKEEDYFAQLCSLFDTHRRARLATLESSDSTEVKLRLLNGLVETARGLEELIRIRVQAGIESPYSVNRARCRRLEAEIELVRFQTGREIASPRPPKPVSGRDASAIVPAELLAKLVRVESKDDPITKLLRAKFKELEIVQKEMNERLGRIAGEDYLAQLAGLTGTAEQLLRTGLELCECAEEAIALRMIVLKVALDFEKEVKKRTDFGTGAPYLGRLASSYRLDQEIELLQAKKDLESSVQDRTVSFAPAPVSSPAPVANTKVGPFRRLLARWRCR